MRASASRYYRENRSTVSFWLTVFLVHQIYIWLIYTLLPSVGVAEPEMKSGLLVFLDMLGPWAFLYAFVISPCIEELLFRSPITYILRSQYQRNTQYVLIFLLQVFFMYMHIGIFSNPSFIYLFLSHGVTTAVLFLIFISVWFETKSTLKAYLSSAAYHCAFNAAVILPRLFYIN